MLDKCKSEANNQEASLFWRTGIGLVTGHQDRQGQQDVKCPVGQRRTLRGPAPATTSPVTAIPATISPVTAAPATTSPVTAIPATTYVTAAPATTSVTAAPATTSPVTATAATTSPACCQCLLFEQVCVPHCAQRPKQLISVYNSLQEVGAGEGERERTRAGEDGEQGKQQKLNDHNSSISGRGQAIKVCFPSSIVVCCASGQNCSCSGEERRRHR